MTDLPARSPASQPVPRNAPTAPTEWLVARIETLREHYYRSELSDMADDMITADWIDCLSDLPQVAVERAFRERIRSDDRRRPIPGEIRAMAKKHLAKTPTQEPPAPFGPTLVSAEEMERRRRQVEELREHYPMLRAVEGEE